LLEERVTAIEVEATRERPLDRASLLALAKEFPHVWTDASTDIRTKKRIVRLLIEEIIAKVAPAPQPQIELVVHWKGGKHTQLVIPRNTTGHHRYCTDRAVVDVVRDLARSTPDAGIARVLNRLGYRTGAGNTWTQHRVLSLRSHHRIAAFDRSTDRNKLLTIADAANVLRVSTATVRRMIERRLLPATQPALYAPWAIHEEDLSTAAVQRATETVRSGGALPRSGESAQLALEDSST